MTNTTLKIKLFQGSQSLTLGPSTDWEMDITQISGLESSDFEVGLTDLAAVDGASLDGRHVKARPIHIEGSFRSTANAAEHRERLVRFFNPKVTGTLLAEIADRKAGTARQRYINYELEGWTLKKQKNLDARVGFIADLICPDPYFTGPEDVGFGGAHIDYDGDVPAGWRATFSGSGSNPVVTNTQTGEFMRVLTTLSGSDVLVISTEDRKQSITLNGESAFRLIDRQSTPFKLQPGYNTLSLGGEGNFSKILTYKPRYLGI